MRKWMSKELDVVTTTETLLTKVNGNKEHLMTQCVNDIKLLGADIFHHAWYERGFPNFEYLEKISSNIIQKMSQGEQTSKDYLMSSIILIFGTCSKIITQTTLVGTLTKSTLVISFIDIHYSIRPRNTVNSCRRQRIYLK